MESKGNFAFIYTNVKRIVQKALERGAAPHVQPNVTSPTIPLLQFDARILGTYHDSIHHGRHTPKRLLAGAR